MTIKDIARECNCAVGTVSRVLNNHPDVSEQMRDKVLAVVNKYDFVLNTNAKQLKSQNRKTIVILVKGTSSILLTSLLERIQKKIELLPYNASVVVLDEYDNEAKQANRIYYEQKPLGIIFLGGSPDLFQEDFVKIQIPCVIISTEAKDSESNCLSSVSTDNRKAAEYSAQYLIQNGHRKIGVIGGELESSRLSRRRYEGFLNAMRDGGLDFDYENHYVVSKYSFEGGAKAVRTLLNKYPDMTAIFTMSDAMAIGAARELNDMGINVPNQISIIGFDGIDLADFYCPRITTIRQLIDNLADDGINALLDCIEKGTKPVHKLIPFEFVQGESVKRLFL